jgi:hypothetical protein
MSSTSNDAELNVLEDPNSSDKEKEDAMYTIIKNAKYLKPINKEQCKEIFRKLAKDDISKNGRIDVLNENNTSAPSTMMAILADIESNEYTYREILVLLDKQTSQVHSSSQAKGRKSKKSKKSKKTRKSRKSKRTKKTRKSRK